MKRALKKFINPYLNNAGYKVDKVKFVGLFNNGDFERKGFPFRPFMFGGLPIHSTYIYLYISNANNPVRITARIMTLFLFVKKVDYSSDVGNVPKSQS